MRGAGWGRGGFGGERKGAAGSEGRGGGVEGRAVPLCRVALKLEPPWAPGQAARSAALAAMFIYAWPGDEPGVKGSAFRSLMSMCMAISVQQVLLNVCISPRSPRKLSLVGHGCCTLWRSRSLAPGLGAVCLVELWRNASSSPQPLQTSLVGFQVGEAEGSCLGRCAAAARQARAGGHDPLGGTALLCLERASRPYTGNTAALGLHRRRCPVSL